MLFSNKDLRKIILPLMVEQILAITIGMLDTVMVSSAGEAAVSGVSLVDALNLLLIYLFSAMASGGAIVAAQLLGAKELTAAKEAAKQLLGVILMASSAICLLSVSLRSAILMLIYGKVDAAIMANAKAYFLFTALSFPFYGMYLACGAIFRVEGNTKLSMSCSLVMNLLNLGGNALLIFVFRMGAAGAAIATLFSRMVGAAVMLIRIRGKDHPLCIDRLRDYRPRWQPIKAICCMGIPNGIENSMFQFGIVATQSIVSNFVATQITANAVARSVVPMQYTLGSAVSLAMVVVIGRCIGAREEKQAVYYAKKLLIVAYSAVAVVVSLMWIFSRPLVATFRLSSETAELARALILFCGICTATVWPVGFVLPNAMRAAGDVRATMVVSVFSMWVFRVGLAYVLGDLLEMGIWGVWLGMACDWTFRAIVFVVRFLKKAWLNKQLA